MGLNLCPLMQNQWQPDLVFLKLIAPSKLCRKHEMLLCARKYVDLNLTFVNTNRAFKLGFAYSESENSSHASN